MKLVSKTVEAIVTETFVLENELGEKVTVIDYLDDRGKAIDTIVRDKNGNPLMSIPTPFSPLSKNIYKNM
jgi:hypothetical protein